jgi:hypothetical protein
MSARCSQTIYGERMNSWQCLRAGKVERSGKWYCRQHDPEAKAKRQADCDAKWKAERAAEAAIIEEGERIAARLGVSAGVYYQVSLSVRGSGYRRKLVISFEDAERLADKLSDE